MGMHSPDLSHEEFLKRLLKKNNHIKLVAKYIPSSSRYKSLLCVFDILDSLYIVACRDVNGYIDNRGIFYGFYIYFKHKFNWENLVDIWNIEEQKCDPMDSISFMMGLLGNDITKFKTFIERKNKIDKL